jgi:glycosyltransferase involved in cell wall biosynthesis
MTVTVAISTRNRTAKLQRLLDALEQQTRQPDEVIVVDASQPLSEIEHKGRFDFHHLPASEPNLPLQRWEALQHARGDVIAYFDDDVIPDPQFLAVAVRRFEQDQAGAIGGVTGWVINQPAPALDRSGSIRQRLSGMSRSENARVAKGGLVVWFSDRPVVGEVEVPCLIGPSMLYRAVNLRALGPQPWLYDLYRAGQGRAEDLILSSLVRRSGCRLLMIPEIAVIHDTTGGGTPWARRGFNKGMADSWGRYLCSRAVASRWELRDRLAFLRYALLLAAANTIRTLDMRYLAGAASGLCKCITRKLPFCLNVANDASSS